MANHTPGAHSDDVSLFHLLVDSVQDYAIFALDPGGNLSTWNTGAQRIKGYRPADIIGRHFSVFYTDEDRASGKPAHLLGIAEAEGRAEDEGWRVRKDGTRFWANVVLTALRSPDGTLVGFAKVTRDLTERREAEQALALRERQLADAQTLAGLGSWEWDAAANRVTWTDELFRIYGLDAATFDATFEGYMQRVAAADRPRVQAEIEAALQQGRSFEFEERIVRPDGTTRVLRSRGRAVRDETGRTTVLMGACLDITELKQAETQAIELAREQAARQASEASTEGLRFLLTASETLASSLDYEASLQRIAQLAVPGVADWFAVDLVQEDGSLRRVAVAHADPDKVVLARRYLEAYPPRRDAGTGSWRVIDSGQPEHYPHISDEMLAAGARDDGELAMLRQLGLRSVVIAPLPGRSNVLGALTLVQSESGRHFADRDVHFARELGRHTALAIENANLHRALEAQHRRLQEQARTVASQAGEIETEMARREVLMAELERANADLEQRTHEAEHANRAKSQFLATMSHELRTPLNAIFGYADLIEIGVYGPVTRQQLDALDRIKRNQRALLSLINDVLNFAKLQAGRLEINMRVLPLREVIDDLEKIVAPQLRAKGLNFESQPFDPDERVEGDRERIEQVLLNLLTNAIKFTDSGGTVSLSVAAENGAITIRVHDTGRGIPEDRLLSIFDPFVQIERYPGASGEPGVGLGLAISRELAEAMGGTLDVRSAVGKGSVFALTLRRPTD